MSGHATVRVPAWLHRTARVMLGLVLAAAMAWCGLALWYQAAAPWRVPLLAGWTALGAAVLAAPLLRRWRRPVLIAAALALAGWSVWWGTLKPSHDRDWADDVARLLQAQVDGERIVLRNVRNFRWRSEQDYDIGWETRQYRLDQLVSGDLLLSYWMGPAIAHTLVSFGFADGRQLTFSLEIRKERGETFSALAGFFRRYEAVLVAADERDIVRVRTNVRGEQVYLYRLALAPAQLRQALLGYVHEAGAIRSEPRFYNTLTSNCTTIVFDLARQIAPGLPLDHRLLLSGHFAEYAYDHGGLVAGYDFATLHARGDVTARARSSDRSDRPFSAVIREACPAWRCLRRRDERSDDACAS